MALGAYERLMNRTDPDRDLIDAVGEALELEPSGRVAFLERSLRDRPDLIGTARRVLEAAERAEHGPDPADSFRIPAEWLEGSTGEIEPRLADGRAIGSYRIKRFIAAGGMGEVYEAEDERLGRRVAIKVLQVASGPRRSQRFLREASLLARLEHPAIVRLYERGVAEIDGETMAFMAMEFVDGLPLAETLAAEPHRRSPRAVVELILPIVDAVAYAHGRGVLHRDLKPANVLVDLDGKARLLDFGVATLLDREDGISVSATGAASMAGTLAYMSPEHLRGGSAAVTTQSDVYGLGLILLESMAGRPVVAGDGMGVAEVVRRVVDEPLPALGSLRPGTRGDLEAIVAAAVAREPERRYASAAALGAELRRYLAGEPPLVRPPGTLATVRTLVRRHRRGIAIAAAIAAVAASGVALAAVQFLRAREAEARSELLVGQLVEGSRPIVLELHRSLAERQEPLSARKAALEAAIEYLAWVREVAGDDERVLEAVARNYLELASVIGGAGMGSLGEFDESRSMLLEAKALWERLLASAATPKRHQGYSDTFALLGLLETGEDKARLLAEAAREFRRGLERTPGGGTEDRPLRVALVRELYAATAAHDPDGIRAAIEGFARLESRLSGDAEYWSEVGLAWRYLTQELETLGDPAACAAAESCRIALERSMSLGQVDFSNERHLARTELSLVACAVGSGDPADLEARALAAVDRSRRAWEMQPGSNFHRISHAETVRQFGEVVNVLAASLAASERPAFSDRAVAAMRDELGRLEAAPVEGERHLREDSVLAQVNDLAARLASPAPAVP
jgi:serine/threonine protein kinase